MVVVVMVLNFYIKYEYEVFVSCLWFGWVKFVHRRKGFDR